MIDKKLIREVGSSLYHIKRNVGYQWLMLVLNILLITVLTWLQGVGERRLASFGMERG